jgi:hypothetical protein
LIPFHFATLFASKSKCSPAFGDVEQADLVGSTLTKTSFGLTSEVSNVCGKSSKQTNPEQKVPISNGLLRLMLPC